MGEGTSPVGHIYNMVNSPLASTMFALLAFFIASAAFRAFRARNVEATLLLVTAILMMIGRVSDRRMDLEGLPGIHRVAPRRAQPGRQARHRDRRSGSGAVSTGLKIILGIERGYLGGTK